jgi:hypothetical protein
MSTWEKGVIINTSSSPRSSTSLREEGGQGQETKAKSNYRRPWVDKSWRIKFF